MDTLQEQIEQTITGVRPNTEQRYISTVLTGTPDDMYDPTDFKAVRGALYKNTLKSLSERFPLYNDRYSLGLEDVDFDDPEEFSLKDQKKALLEGGSLGRRIRGSWVLTDINTGQVVQKTPRRTILKVPYITERGTFIRNGSEYTFNHIMRMEPGVYTYRKGDDQILSQINAKQGTGTRVDINFKPSTGLFQFSRGTVNAPAYRVLSDYGISDETMKNAWGDELFKLNKEYGSNERAVQAATRFYSRGK